MLQVYDKAQSAFDHFDRTRGSLAGEQAGRGSKTLLAAQRHLGAFNHTAARQSARSSRRASSCFALVDGQRSRLQDQEVGEAVHGQAGQAIVLGVDQAQRIGVVHIGQRWRAHAMAAARRLRQKDSSIASCAHVSRRTWIWLRRFR